MYVYIYYLYLSDYTDIYQSIYIREYNIIQVSISREV